MHVSDFDYDLPETLIAQKPLKQRDQSRLLLLNRMTQKYSHKHFFDLCDILTKNDVLVLNQSRVIPARLYTKEGYEVFLLKKITDTPITYECLVKPGKKFPKDAEIHFQDGYTANVSDILEESGIRVIQFPFEDFDSFLEKHGNTPLPPYIQEKLSDPERYQTVYNSQNHHGSVAAPTAGLHFTPDMIHTLQKKGIIIEYVTLHVGLGTFQPVKVDNIKKHSMHSEYYSINEKTAQNLNRHIQEKKRIIAVGTTSVRVLESASDEHGIIHPFTGETDIFIYPGYIFRFVDALITNFHLPKSTLLMLISAFAGKEFIFQAYKEAIQEGYRFYSFGDAMFIE